MNDASRLTVKELAEIWLQTPGALNAMKIDVSMRDGHPRSGVAMGTSAIVMTFLGDWLKAYTGRRDGDGIMPAVYDEATRQARAKGKD